MRTATPQLGSALPMPGAGLPFFLNPLANMGPAFLPLAVNMQTRGVTVPPPAPPAPAAATARRPINPWLLIGGVAVLAVLLT